MPGTISVFWALTASHPPFGWRVAVKLMTPNGMVLTDLMPVRPPKTDNVNEVGVLHKEGRQGLRIHRVPGSSELLGDLARVTGHRIGHFPGSWGVA